MVRAATSQTLTGNGEDDVGEESEHADRRCETTSARIVAKQAHGFCGSGFGGREPPSRRHAPKDNDGEQLNE
ncbi:unnamed protein product [Soboliphyme baturini]|uniref:Uncharacterized protein n=1 Tax=Soboliphyme baturini TaxID=241478 RepID=A0A183J8Q5_9BILA|nr:unnamed protein product [Soboliphyme baturini]